MTFSKTDHWISAKLLPRSKQIEAIEWFLKNQHKKYFFLELPVGTGKSYVGLSIAKILGQIKPDGKLGSYVLTPQRILQEQYEQTAGDHVISLYGKSNYDCHTHDTTCDIGGILNGKEGCAKCEGCPYKAAFAAAENTRGNLVLNYALALKLFSFVPKFNRRDVLIFDECHNLEKFLVEFGSPTISKRRCDKAKVVLPTTKDPQAIIEWVERQYKLGFMRYINELEELETEISERRNRLSQADISILRELSSATDHIAEVNSLLKQAADWEKFSTKYVLVRDDTSIAFKPLHAVDQFRSICEPKAEKFVFMSATILDHREFCKNLGIDINQAAFLSVDSDFPVENRPVMYLPQMKMNYQWNDANNAKNRNKMLATIREIIEQHEGDSGIIHTGNFQIAEWLVNNLKVSSHTIFHHNPRPGVSTNRNQVIQGFTDSKSPAILISPSITEGLDLKDDLSRFAVIAKVPYKNLADTWIKRRMELSSRWYQLQAITDIIQGCGRVVRSADDWGVTYILDSSWGYLYNTNRNVIPKWWQAGLS